MLPGSFLLSLSNCVAFLYHLFVRNTELELLRQQLYCILFSLEDIPY